MTRFEICNNMAYASQVQFEVLRRALWVQQAQPQTVFDWKFWERAARDPKMTTYLKHGVKAKMCETTPFVNSVGSQYIASSGKDRVDPLAVGIWGVRGFCVSFLDENLPLGTNLSAKRQMSAILLVRKKSCLPGSPVHRPLATECLSQIPDQAERRRSVSTLRPTTGLIVEYPRLLFQLAESGPLEVFHADCGLCGLMLSLSSSKSMTLTDRSICHGRVPPTHLQLTSTPISAA